MFSSGLLFLLLIQQAKSQAVVPTQPQSAAASIPSINTTQNDDPKSERDLKLLNVRRIYVESFGEDAISKQIQAMVVSSLLQSKRFTVTEVKEKADAVLKGTALEKTSQELHAFGEATSVAGAAGGHSGSISGNWNSSGGSLSGSSAGGFASRAASIEDSSANTETINDARVTVRLVDAEGDVIWATTQESKGGKYKGAAADAADMVVKQLHHDIERLLVKSQVK